MTHKEKVNDILKRIRAGARRQFDSDSENAQQDVVEQAQPKQKPKEEPRIVRDYTLDDS